MSAQPQGESRAKRSASRRSSDPLAEARAATEKRDFDRAVAAYEQAANARPQDPVVLLEFGQALWGVGHADRALDVTERAVSLAKDDRLRAEALLQLGDSYRRMERPGEALRAWEEAERAASRVGEVKLLTAIADRRRSYVAPSRPKPAAPLRLSPTVRDVARELGQRLVPAGEIAHAVLRRHPEYGDDRSSSVRLDGTAGEMERTADDWLQEVRTLFHRRKVPELHGRVVVIGLTLLEEGLRRQLEERAFLTALVRELREPLETILVNRGLGLWRREQPPPEPAAALPEAEETPTHTDNPALVDELGRKGFAKVLARRIKDMREEERENAKRIGDERMPRGGSFLVHLHAPWGAGKTSTLNFLSDDLRRERWVVVNFNAWRHQRIVPPWWWLMTAIYSEALRELRTKWPARGERRLPAHARALSLVAREWIWRLRGGWPGYLMLFIAAGLLVLIWQQGFLSGLADEKLRSWETVRGLLVAAAAVITPALVVWGLLRGAGHWVFATSARGARRYMDNTRDPMRAVQEHVRDLIGWIGRDVVVLIDDLDRCKGPYVVELLEGIQTIFRDIPVAYVVAADRDWLSDSYAAEYRKFVSAADEPGRPLGYLFLEKTFQISTTLPPIGDQLESFWNRLLRKARLPNLEAVEEATASAEEALKGKPSAELFRAAEDAREAAKSNGSESAVTEYHAVLQAVAVETAGARAAEEAAHTLEPFRELLDPNPRAMKRLVNAYGITRAAETLRGHNLERDAAAEHRTALWTILNLRWPRLGEHLAKHPDDVTALTAENGKPPRKVDAGLASLFGDPEVKAVITGAPNEVRASLDADVIRAYTNPTASTR